MAAMDAAAGGAEGRAAQEAVFRAVRSRLTEINIRQDIDLVAELVRFMNANVRAVPSFLKPVYTVAVAVAYGSFPLVVFRGADVEALQVPRDHRAPEDPAELEATRAAVLRGIRERLARIAERPEVDRIRELVDFANTHMDVFPAYLLPLYTTSMSILHGGMPPESFGAPDVDALLRDAHRRRPHSEAAREAMRESLVRGARTRLADIVRLRHIDLVYELVFFLVEHSEVLPDYLRPLYAIAIGVARGAFLMDSIRHVDIDLLQHPPRAPVLPAPRPPPGDAAPRPPPGDGRALRLRDRFVELRAEAREAGGLSRLGDFISENYSQLPTHVRRMLANVWTVRLRFGREPHLDDRPIDVLWPLGEPIHEAVDDENLEDHTTTLEGLAEDLFEGEEDPRNLIDYLNALADYQAELTEDLRRHLDDVQGMLRARLPGPRIAPEGDEKAPGDAAMEDRARRQGNARTTRAMHELSERLSAIRTDSETEKASGLSDVLWSYQLDLPQRVAPLRTIIQEVVAGRRGIETLVGWDTGSQESMEELAAWTARPGVFGEEAARLRLADRKACVTRLTKIINRAIGQFREDTNMYRVLQIGQMLTQPILGQTQAAHRLFMQVLHVFQASQPASYLRAYFLSQADRDVDTRTVSREVFKELPRELQRAFDYGKAMERNQENPLWMREVPRPPPDDEDAMSVEGDGYEQR